jgi:ABC-type multidrug transport system ATPase subunit
MSDAIVVEGLVKRYGDMTALDGIDLTVPRAPSSGCSAPTAPARPQPTRLTTLLRPDAGRVEVAGVDVLADPAAVRSRIGLAGQSAAVDENLTGRENACSSGASAASPSPTHGPARRAPRPLRADRRGGARAKTYSGGMRRRLDLAAALVDEPEVLFLDEPTTGLDPRSRNDLWTVIEELVADGSTLLLTTQYLEEADRLADRIAVVDSGRIIAEGTPPSSRPSWARPSSRSATSTPRRPPRRRRPSSPRWAPRPSTARGCSSPVDDGRAPCSRCTCSRRAQLPPTTLALREPSLDDVFLTLTGHTTEVS